MWDTGADDASIHHSDLIAIDPTGALPLQGKEYELADGTSVIQDTVGVEARIESAAGQPVTE